LFSNWSLSVEVIIISVSRFITNVQCDIVNDAVPEKHDHNIHRMLNKTREYTSMNKIIEIISVHNEKITYYYIFMPREYCLRV